VTVRIDCPPPGWIPGSTRCAVIHVTQTCFAAWACCNEAQRLHSDEVPEHSLAWILSNTFPPLPETLAKSYGKAA